MTAKDEHRVEVLFIPSEVTGTCGCSTMHKVGEQCQILEWEKDLLIKINFKILELNQNYVKMLIT